MVAGGNQGFAGFGLLWVGLAGGDCGFVVGLFLIVILVVGGWVVVAVGVSVGGGGSQQWVWAVAMDLWAIKMR